MIRKAIEWPRTGEIHSMRLSIGREPEFCGILPGRVLAGARCHTLSSGSRGREPRMCRIVGLFFKRVDATSAPGPLLTRMLSQMRERGPAIVGLS
jgi:hypothetical protein